MEDQPFVSVIIPSIGKPSLGEAVASVLRQTYSNYEIVVRLDPLAPIHAALDLPRDSRIRVVDAEQHEDISVSRERALVDCRGSLIAFLDDDDRFLEQKLEVQIAVANRALSMGADHIVVACRVILHDLFGRTRIVPRELKAADQLMSEYLFRRRQIRPDAAGVGASMILCDRKLALELASGAPSSLHEDWEWAIRADQHPNTLIIMVPDVLTERMLQPKGTSASSRASWRASAQWLVDHEGMLSSRCQADFLLCVTLPLAVSQRDWRGALKIVGRSLKTGLPGPCAWTFAILYVLLPARVRRLATASTFRIQLRNRPIRK
jgi:hypothetical protein